MKVIITPEDLIYHQTPMFNMAYTLLRGRGLNTELKVTYIT